MENNLEYILKDYLPSFSEISTNLLFYGNPGSGKTYLSYCIAKSVLDMGFLVIYKTSDELIKNLREIRFNNDSGLESLLLECDLLIVDDLGAEHLNEFSVTELFNIINKRILANKKMLISTNLTLPGITKQYSERIASRLIGEFKLCKFYSEDIRIKKNLEKIDNLNKLNSNMIFILLMTIILEFSFLLQIDIINHIYLKNLFRKLCYSVLTSYLYLNSL